LERSPSLPPSTGTAGPGASADKKAPVRTKPLASPDGGAPAPPGSTIDAEPEAVQPARAAGQVLRPRREGPIPLDRRTATVVGTTIFLLLLIMWAGTGYRYEPYVEETLLQSRDRAAAGAQDLKQLSARLQVRGRQLQARLKAAAPRGVYIVIDQTHNRLYLKKNDETLLEAVCSAGSGMVLKEGTGKKRQWVFDTPRGAFEVLSRRENPVWAKPDWAFVEEGEPIPKNPADRLEYGSLGEYALNFGNGYMIHGTLYERLLGRAVSHGCIRVGRDDLRKVWATTTLGTRIYIY
jgi:lipoprotein-anchoring transpeptidase ErfK/SrfK